MAGKVCPFGSMNSDAETRCAETFGAEPQVTDGGPGNQDALPGSAVAAGPGVGHAPTHDLADGAAVVDDDDAGRRTGTRAWAKGSPLDPFLPVSDTAPAWDDGGGGAFTGSPQFDRSTVSATAAGPRPAPLPTRPKGRLVIATVVLVLCGGATFAVWNSFFRYQAYGLVTGRRIHVSAAWQGVVRAFHVREGDPVRQGQLLATVENLPLVHRLADVADRLRLAQAELDAELSRLAWQARTQGDRAQKAVAEYYELWGTLLQEQARLQDLEARQLRQSQLRKQRIITEEQWDSVRFATAGQRARLDKLRTAVKEMKKRAAQQTDPSDEALTQVKPRLMRVEVLQDELRRLRDEVKQGEIRSPVDGRVVKRARFSGEHADPAQPILTVLEEGSLQVLLYLPQRRANLLRVGDEVPIRVPPHRQAIRCRVVRIGDELHPAPDSLKRFYHRDERLLPVHLEPTGPLAGNGVLRLDSEIRLPAGWPQPISWLLTHVGGS